MGHHTNQGQKFAVLLLASSILIAGLLVGGAIVTRNNNQDTNIKGIQDPQRNIKQLQSIGTQAPSCGV